jgi:hypothetical protein
LGAFCHEVFWAAVNAAAEFVTEVGAVFVVGEVEVIFWHDFEGGWFGFAWLG